MNWRTFSIETSGVLAVIMALAACVAIFQIIRDRRDWQILAIFALIVIGSSAREFIVAFAPAPGTRLPIAFMFSAMSKWMVITGAVLFVWRYTAAICGPWAAIVLFLLSAFLSVVLI
jgi:hypothetical protein